MKLKLKIFFKKRFHKIVCGLLFLDQKNSTKISLQKFNDALSLQLWRGPDSQNIITALDGRFILGHNRLSIIDPAPRSNQPMLSACGRYMIIYSGEIYNHLEIRKKYNINYKTNSDTETILEGYARDGDEIFSLLDGMFALVILDIHSCNWVAVRDPFGIKPLYINQTQERVLISSETNSISNLINTTISSASLDEWRMIRRPIPGHTFFEEIYEILPGQIISSNKKKKFFWTREQRQEHFDQYEFESLVANSIKSHQLSDCENVGLLSGGFDSAIITAFSDIKKTYCIGLENNNEFSGANKTAKKLERNLRCIKVHETDIKNTWSELIKIRKEPLSVPNEALIYLACKEMETTEKVVLTGEGADELLFGYDKIFRWAHSNPKKCFLDFFGLYGYASPLLANDRLISYVEDLGQNKNNIQFIEDFFYEVHLTGLLRRMDFASMAASKEARVPFVNKAIVNYMYRQPFDIRVNHYEAKIPFRILAVKLGLKSVLQDKKVGFSATFHKNKGKLSEYSSFQDFNLKSLGWS